MSNDRHCPSELGGGGGGGQLYLGKRINKIEHEGMGTCGRIEVSQEAENADQKVKWFLKVHKNRNFCGKHVFSYLFSNFIFRFTFKKFVDFHPPENES